MTSERFKLVALVNSSNLDTIRPVLEGLIKEGSVRAAEAGGLVLEAVMEGSSAKELNRSLLSTLRRVEKRTTLRAEWTSSDDITQRFFDYVLKKTFRKAT